MPKAISIAAVVVSTLLAACDRGAGKQTENDAAPSLPYRQASAAEVFALRSKCVELGQKILADDLHGPQLAVDMKSNYNARTNRCYVELDAWKIDDMVHNHHETLFDGQSREILAGTDIKDGKRSGMIFADLVASSGEPDPYLRAANYIAKQMEDDRTN